MELKDQSWSVCPLEEASLRHLFYRKTFLTILSLGNNKEFHKTISCCWQMFLSFFSWTGSEYFIFLGAGVGAFFLPLQVEISARFLPENKNILYEYLIAWGLTVQDCVYLKRPDHYSENAHLQSQSERLDSSNGAFYTIVNTIASENRVGTCSWSSFPIELYQCLFLQFWSTLLGFPWNSGSNSSETAQTRPNLNWNRTWNTYLELV